MTSAFEHGAAGRRDGGAADGSAPRAVVVVGGSAGAHDALARLVGALPGDLDAAVLVVVHRSEDGPSHLARLLEPLSLLDAVDATDSLPLSRGTLAVAPPGRHLLVDGGVCRVVRGPRENRQRPAIDPLFRSAAYHHGSAVVGVLLSGLLDDGVAGLWAIRTCGGATVVQDPDDALFAAMPGAAVEAFEVDHRAPAAELGSLVARLVNQVRPAALASPAPLHRFESELAAMDNPQHAFDGLRRAGRLTPFTCPVCQGPLWELGERAAARFRCHTGHAFSTPALAAAHEEAVELALFEALRALEQQAVIARRLADRARESGHLGTVATFEDRQRRALVSARTIRDLLLAPEDA